MKKCLKGLSLLAVAFSQAACFNIQPAEHQFQKLAPGPWRGHFLVGEEAEEAGGLQQATIDMQVLGSEQGKEAIALQFISGSDTLKADSLRFKNDTLYAYFLEKGTYLRAVYEIEVMEGELHDAKTGEVLGLLFNAQRGYFSRFPDLRRPPVAAVEGTWEVVASDRAGQSQIWELNLASKGNRVTGTAQRQDQAGAKIVVEGSIQADRLLLSGFDGREALLFNGKLSAQGADFEAAALYLANQALGAEGRKR